MTYLEQVAIEIEQEARPHAAPDAEMRGLFLAYAVLALAKAETTTAPDVHDAWAARMLDRGREHPSLVPYEELATDVQGQDEPFVAAIRRVARRRQLRGRYPDAQVRR